MAALSVGSVVDIPQNLPQERLDLAGSVVVSDIVVLTTGSKQSSGRRTQENHEYNLLTLRAGRFSCYLFRRHRPWC